MIPSIVYLSSLVIIIVRYSNCQGHLDYSIAVSDWTRQQQQSVDYSAFMGGVSEGCPTSQLQPVCVVYQSNTCSLCLEGYVLDLGTGFCIKCPYLCSTCTLEGRCLTCSPGNYLTSNNNTCQSCQVLECVLCVGYLYCLKCGTGYMVAGSSPLCVPCIGHCEYCVSANMCIFCIQGYYLANPSSCKACAANCVNCNVTATNCTSCNINYFLNVSDGQCVPCFHLVNFCVVCELVADQPGIECLQCVIGFIKIGNQCEKCAGNCAVCTNLTTCTTCDQAFYLSPNKSCQLCELQGCVQCKTSSICLSCNNYYFLNSTTKLCQPCPPNCLFCNNSTYCKSCDVYMSPINGLCQTCQIPNCIGCSKSVYHCSLCNLNFFKKVDYGIAFCMPCPIFCPDCNSDVTCNSCQPGTFLVMASYCLPCAIENCFICKSNTTCSVCQQGYYLNAEGNQCSACTANCSVCNYGAACQLCNAGFYTENGFCYSCQPVCKLCLGQQNCIECVSGYYLFQNHNETLCVPCAKGCQNCQSLFLCLQCFEGFYLNQNICVKCENSCLICTSQQQCSLCAPNFGISLMGMCQPCPIGCLKCHYILQCELCVDGYSLSLSPLNNDSLTCVKCVENCLKCHSIIKYQLRTSTQICQKCINGFIMSVNGLCFKCGQTPFTQGCTQCNQNGQCLTCKQKYIINSNGTCINNNYVIIQHGKGLMGACIGLGCLLFILLISFLYLKFEKKYF